MKTKIALIAIALFISRVMFAQTLVVDSRFGDTYTHEQGELIMTSTLGPPIPATDYQNNLVVVTDHINLPLTTDTTSIHDLATLKGIQVYPNPTPDLLVMRRDNTEEDYTVAIFDASGQTLQQLIWTKGIQSLQISFASYPEGIYFVNITNTGLKERMICKVQKQ